MSIFENSFFTIEGQKERLANVGATLKAAVTGKGVQSNTGIKPIDTTLSVAASNPFTTAAAVFVGKAGGIKQAVSIVTAAPKVAGFTAIAAPVSASLIAESGVKKSAETVGKAPTNLGQFTSNVYEFAKDPSIENFKDIYKENPYIAGATTAAAGYIVGKSAYGAYVGSQIAKDNTIPTSNIDLSGIPKEVKSISEKVIQADKSQGAITPITPETQIMGKAASSVSKRSTSTQKRKPLPIINRINVNIMNQSRLTKKYIY